MRISLLFLLVLLSGCIGSSKKEPQKTEAPVSSTGMPPTATDDAEIAYFYALKFYKERNFTKAEQEFYSFLQVYANSKYFLAGWVAYGEVLMRLGKWDEAVEAFRNVNSRVSFVRTQLKARALMSVSFSYEMLSQNEKALTALFDAIAYKKGLSEIEKNVLVPARMATIYARLGNRSQAEKYSMRANEAIQLIRDRGVHGEVDKHNFADLLYRMGRNPIGAVKSGKTEDIIFGIQVSQEFLLQSLESGIPPFTRIIGDELSQAYGGILKRFEGSNKAEDVEKKQKWAVAILESIDRFRYSRLPQTPAAAEESMNKVLKTFGEIEKKVFSWIAENSIEVRRTSEEEMRSGLKREGRIIDEHLLKSRKRKPYLLIDLDQELSKDPNL